ncbi:hypothetical protein MVEN_01825100 [Mycena venus]|uniref:DUF6699 domain-containing protein n=1 Tax=Mycena venus TaxID=2733690 RepID=A0A8H6XLA8_9AGAR|nr:hypothetical protein MVEN_01825100 [Mycena venus]
MAAPFIYVPEASTADATSYNPQYYAAQTTPQKGQTPFLPPSPLLYPSSPYLGPVDGGAAASDANNKFDPNSVLWPDSASQYESARTRWLSIHPAQGPCVLTRPVICRAGGHKRAKSWGNADAPALPPWAMNANKPAPMQVHPWLNGDAPSPIFFFDIAPKAFAPQRAVSTNPPQGMALGAAEVREPAFHPPLTSLRILHPRLPFWPIDLALPKDMPPAQAPPITLGDVLAAIHNALHVRIAPADWATLSSEDQQRVTVAFTQRCRAEAVRSKASPAQLRDREVEERNQGVKRVDFLLGKTVFKGLVRSPGDPEGCVRMVTA